MSQVKTFKLIVQESITCRDVLRYLNKNIIQVNQLGARVAIEKISKKEFDEDMIELLRKKGITRLPTLIAPDGKLFVGLQKIIDLFEKNLNSARNNERINPCDYGPTDTEMGSNPDLSAYWQQFMVRNERGKFDDDEKDVSEDKWDPHRDMEKYRRNMPKHHKIDNGRERNIDRQVPETRRRRRDDPPEDNIASEEEEGYDESPPAKRPQSRAPRLSASDDARGDDMDQRMLAAWMDNNV